MRFPFLFSCLTNVGMRFFRIHRYFEHQIPTINNEMLSKLPKLIPFHVYRLILKINFTIRKMTQARQKRFSIFEIIILGAMPINRFFGAVHSVRSHERDFPPMENSWFIELLVD